MDNQNFDKHSLPIENCSLPIVNCSLPIVNCSLPIANCILTIAGFDPSGGAGLVSDVKTFEAHNLYGLSVCTAITVQNDIEFKLCKWVDEELILSQIDVLFKRFKINVVKIGIVENWERLNSILKKLHQLNVEIKIILDPVLKSSSGFDFHSKDNFSTFEEVLKHVYVITPNYDEVKQLYPLKSIEETITHLCTYTNVYFKGGHRPDKKGWDELFYDKIVQVSIPPHQDKIYEKHGSGCVLSSALASNINLGYSIEDASKNAKLYTEAFLCSHKSMLGNHKNLITN